MKRSLASPYLLFCLCFAVPLSALAQVAPPVPSPPPDRQAQRTPEWHVNAGNEAAAAKRYDKAIDSFKQALSLDPKLVSAHLGLSAAYQQLGSYEESLAAIKQAVMLNPTDLTANGRLGEVYLAMRRPADAVEAFKQTGKLFPNSGKAQLGLGNAYFELGRIDQAMDAYLDAVRLEPSLAAAYYNLGNAYTRLGRDEESLKWLKKSLELSPNYELATYLLGMTNYRLKRYAEAVEVLDRLERIRPLDLQNIEARAFANFYLGKSGAAASDAQSFLRAGGWRQRQSPYLALVGYYGSRQAGRTAEAEKLLSAAAQQLPLAQWPFPVFRYLRGEISGAELLKTAGNNDETTEAKTYLGLELSLSGKRAEALEQLQWVKEYGNRNFVEYPMAINEIKRLEANAPAK